MAETFDIQLRGILVEAPDCCRETTNLNRVLRLEDWGLAYEAGARHVELLREAMSDHKVDPVSTPGETHPPDPRAGTQR